MSIRVFRRQAPIVGSTVYTKALTAGVAGVATCTPVKTTAGATMHVTTTPVLYTTIVNDVGSTVNVKLSLGVSKHLDGAVYNGRWYKVFGDHAQIDQNAPALQSGNQNYLSLDLAANTWRQDKNYYTRFAPSPDSKLEQALPDDGSVALRGNEIWTFWSVRDNNSTTTTAQQTATARASYGSDIVQQQMEAITAWNIDTGAFRIAAANRPFEMGNDRQWRTYYDSVLDCFFTPCTVNGETVWILFDGATGNDITWRNAGVAQTWSANGFSKDIRVAGMAVDPSTRNVYTYDHHTNFLWRWSLDKIFTRAWGQEVNVLTVTGEFNASDQSAYKICWHPVLRAVIMSFNQMHAYEVDNGTLTSFAHSDGYTPADSPSLINPSTMFYDAINNDVVAIGGGGAVSNIASNYFWRNHWFKS